MLSDARPFDRYRARAHAVRQAPPPQRSVAFPRGAQGRELCASTEYDELLDLDAICPEFTAQFVECGLDRCCLRDGVFAALGWHVGSVAMYTVMAWSRGKRATT